MAEGPHNLAATAAGLASQQRSVNVPGTAPEPDASPICPARKTSPFASTTLLNGSVPGSIPDSCGMVFGMRVLLSAL